MRDDGITVLKWKDGEMVTLVVDGQFMAAIVNLDKWFMFRRVRLISAFGLNYEWAREQILNEYIKYKKELAK